MPVNFEASAIRLIVPDLSGKGAYIRAEGEFWDISTGGSLCPRDTLRVAGFALPGAIVEGPAFTVTADVPPRTSLTLEIPLTLSEYKKLRRVLRRGQALPPLILELPQ